MQVSKLRGLARRSGVGRLDRPNTSGEIMPKYLCLQRSLSKGVGEKPSSSEMQAMYAKFGAWSQKFQKNLADMGGKLGEGKLVTKESAPDSDGPFVEIKELVGGYMVVEADSLEEAVQVARECPGLVSAGSGVEVIEIHGP